jgi:hypothetical protein
MKIVIVQPYALAVFLIPITLACASAQAPVASTAPVPAEPPAPAAAAPSGITPPVTADCVARAAAISGGGTTTLESAKLQPGNPMPALPVREPRRFVVSVVVDTVGRAQPATLEVPLGLDSATIAAVRAVLPAWRFSPARVGTCPVKQVVRLTFSR